jgi:16S rRNA (cytidine1402-2'-O)-methyltransferase
LPSNEFYFAGFLAPKQTARRKKLADLGKLGCTLVFYEAPHRVRETIDDLLHTLGDRQVCIAREITKIHEEYFFGKLSAARDSIRPLGEFVVVVEGATGITRNPPASRAEVLERLGMTRNELYDLFFRKPVRSDQDGS